MYLRRAFNCFAVPSLIVTLISTITACGSGREHRAEDNVSSPPTDLSKDDLLNLNNDQNKPASHFVFAAIDVMSSPWRSSVYDLNLESDALKLISSGESGDPVIIGIANDAYLFNRSPDSTNMRRMVLNQGNDVDLSPQTKIPTGDLGDPRDVIGLTKDKMLLANSSQGALVVADRLTGQEYSRLNVDWDLPSGAKLRPEALVERVVNGKSYIFVIHQGYSLNAGSMAADGSQSVFVLERTGDQVQPLNQSSSSSKVAGIKVSGSFPIPVAKKGNGSFLLLSLCSRLVNVSRQACHSAVEEIDVTTMTSKVLWDLDGSGLYMNGPVAKQLDGSAIYADMDFKNSSGTWQKVVMKLDVEKKTFSSVYSFNQTFGGFWGVFFNPASKKIYIGDADDKGRGQLIIMHNGAVAKTICLTGVPYSGRFLR